jgi:hypothetical protein
VRNYKLLTLSLFCFSAAFIVTLFCAFEQQLRSEDTAWAIYAVILVAIALLVAIGIHFLKHNDARDTVWLHPPVLLTIWLWISLGLPGLASFFFRHLVVDLRTLVSIDYVYFIWGWGLVLVGLLSLWGGYWIGLQLFRPMKSLDRLGHWQLSMSVVLGFYALTVALRVVRILVTGIAYGAENTNWGPFVGLFNQALGYVEDGRYLVLAILAIQAFEAQWIKLPLWTVITIETVFAFTSGFMKPLFRIMIVVTAAAHSTRVDFRRYYRYVIAFALLGVLIVPIAQNIRLQSASFNTRSPAEVLNATELAFRSSWARGVNTGWQTFLDKIAGRQAAVAHMPGIILRRTPSEIPYLGAEQFLAIPAYIVPRFIWPNKPILTYTTWFSSTYLNMPSDTRSSSAMTLFGESYMIGGWVGTALALFVLGLSQAFLFRNTVNVGLLPAYIAFIPSLIEYERQFTTMLIGLIQGGLVILVIYWLLVKLSTGKKQQLYAEPGRHEISRAKHSLLCDNV